MQISSQAVFGLAVLASLGGATQALALDKVITVSGVCHRQVTPDRASVTVVADILDKELKTAIRQATQQYERLRAAVKVLNLPDQELTTSEYDVREDIEWQKDRRVSKGFRARIGLRIQTSSIDRIGEVMEAAAKEGIKDVGGMSTFLAPKSLQREHFACLEDAAKDAQAKAEKLAGAVGARIGGLVSMSESSSGDFYRPMPMAKSSMAMRAEMDVGGAPGVEAGKQDITVNVTAGFSVR